MLVWLAAGVRAEPGVALDQLRARPLAEDAFTASRPEVPAHLSLHAQIVVDYTNDPLVYESRRGASGSESVALVGDQLRLHVSASLGLLDFALVFAQLPVDAIDEGSRFGAWPTATGFGAGDLAFGGRLVFFDKPLGALAIELTTTAPVAKQGAGVPGVAGDAGATFAPLMIAELDFPFLRITSNAGLRMRKQVNLPGVVFDDELLYALALAVPLVDDQLDAHAEVFGSTPAADLGERAASPLEVLLGLKIHAGNEWSLGLGTGMGLSRGYGAPDVRVLALAGVRIAALGATRARAQPQSESEPEPEQDQDAAVTEAEQPTHEGAPAGSPSSAGAKAAADDDADGMNNDNDSCPALAGPADLGGCPQHFQLDSQTGLLAWTTPFNWKRRRAVIETVSLAVVEELAHVLKQNPKLRVLIETHEVPQDDTALLALITEDRARALVQALLDGGARPAQIDGYGCAGNRPAVSAHGRSARKNERTDVYVTQPLPGNGMPSTLGCESVTTPAPRQEPTPNASPEALREFGDAGPRSRARRILRPGVKTA